MKGKQLVVTLIFRPIFVCIFALAVALEVKSGQSVLSFLGIIAHLAVLIWAIIYCLKVTDKGSWRALAVNLALMILILASLLSFTEVRHSNTVVINSYGEIVKYAPLSIGINPWTGEQILTYPPVIKFEFKVDEQREPILFQGRVGMVGDSLYLKFGLPKKFTRDVKNTIVSFCQYLNAYQSDLPLDEFLDLAQDSLAPVIPEFSEFYLTPLKTKITFK